MGNGTRPVKSELLGLVDNPVFPWVLLSYHYKYVIQLSFVLRVWKIPLSLLLMQVKATFGSRRSI
jgi:hypothetical protein